MAIGFTGTALAGNLDGFFVGAGLSSNATEVDIKIAGVPNTKLSEDGRQLALGLNVGYGKSFGIFYLGADLTYKNNYGKAKGPIAGLVGTNMEIEVKNALALSILPGIYVQPDTLVYGRLGKTRGTGEVNASGPGGSMSDSGTIDGNVIGLGVKHGFTQNLAGTFEYQRVSAQDSVSNSSVDVTASGFSLGIEYRF